MFQTIKEWWERFRSRFDYATKSDLKQLEKKLMGEIADSYKAIAEKVAKIKKEVLDRIAALEDAIKNRSLTTEEKAEFDAAVAKLNELDDVVPDAPPAE